MDTQYLIAIISASATLMVALIGIFGNMFLSNQNRKRELLIKEKEIEQEEVKFLLEHLKGFWEAQSNVLKQTLMTASELTFNPEIESEAFQEAYGKLWQLIHGELPMYDVPEVEQALEEFATHAYAKNRLPPNDAVAIKAKKREMKPFLTNLAKKIKETSIVIEYSKKLKRSVLK